MELRQLRYFVATAKTLSFSAASRKLFITQSTLSQQIHALEDELGARLFSRDSHTVALTEAGDRLLPLAIETIKAAEQCKTQVEDLGNTLTGELNIGVTHSFSTLLTKPLADFLHTYKQVQLHIYYADSLHLMEMLRNHTIDLALAYKSDHAGNDFDSHVLFTDRLCAVVRKDHFLAGRKSITLAELEQDNWGIALPSQQMQARELLDRYWESEGQAAHLRKRIELNDANFILDLLDDSDLLVGILSEDTCRHRRGLVAIPLVENNHPLTDDPSASQPFSPSSLPPYSSTPQSPFTMEGCIHTLSGAYMKRSARIFADMLMNEVKG